MCAVKMYPHLAGMRGGPIDATKHETFPPALWHGRHNVRQDETTMMCFRCKRKTTARQWGRAARLSWVIFVDNCEALWPCFDLLEHAATTRHNLAACMLTMCLSRPNSGAGDDTPMFIEYFHILKLLSI